MINVCEICGSNKGVRNYKNNGIYYCAKHAYQMKMHGKILSRTIYDANEIILKDCFALICLYDKKLNEVARTIIDSSDIDLVLKYKWYLNSNGYVCHRSNGAILYLHRLILNVDDDSIVDHINMNKLDNRKENLRLCTNAENMRNKKEIAKNYSGFRGVNWNKVVKKWSSSLTLNKKSIHLGWYDLFDDAVNARIQGEIKYYGEFAPKKD